ncbi:MAG: undecaprenyl-diphosphate phosphatase [Mycobacteriales bacterium]|nr:undecaprenyl-diphosphate phosphatase [Frankia sp.]
MTAFAAATSCVGDTRLHLSIWQSAVLGATQGLSEFLPVSSSGHLILVPWAANWRDVYCAKQGNKFFDVALHMGTFLGAVIYLRREVRALVRGFFSSVRARAVRTTEERLAWLLVFSAIPGALAGALFEDVIAEKLGQPWQIAAFLAVFGILLYVVDRRAAQRTAMADLSRTQVGAMAVAQMLALMPGVSRSGVTITAARAGGVDRDAAARFSFLMSLPIIFGAGLYGALSLSDGGGLNGQTLQFAVGVVVSAITGAVAVFGLLSYLRRHSFGAFAVYRLAAAAAVVALIATGARSATI